MECINEENASRAMSDITNKSSTENNTKSENRTADNNLDSNINIVNNLNNNNNNNNESKIIKNEPYVAIPIPIYHQKLNRSCENVTLLPGKEHFVQVNRRTMDNKVGLSSDTIYQNELMYPEIMSEYSSNKTITTHRKRHQSTHSHQYLDPNRSHLPLHHQHHRAYAQLRKKQQDVNLDSSTLADLNTLMKDIADPTEYASSNVTDELGDTIEDDDEQADDETLNDINLAIKYCNMRKSCLFQPKYAGKSKYRSKYHNNHWDKYGCLLNQCYNCKQNANANYQSVCTSCQSCICTSCKRLLHAPSPQPLSHHQQSYSEDHRMKYRRDPYQNNSNNYKSTNSVLETYRIVNGCGGSAHRHLLPTKSQLSLQEKYDSQARINYSKRPGKVVSCMEIEFCDFDDGSAEKGKNTLDDDTQNDNTIDRKQQLDEEKLKSIKILAEDAMRIETCPDSIAAHLKQKLDELYGSSWHVITGTESFGSNLASLPGTLASFQIQKFGFLIWKT